MKKIKSLLIMLFSVATISTLSGCVLGLSTGGSGLVTGGAVLFLLSNNLSHYGSDPACFWGFVGFALDEKNPGRMNALNPLPLNETLASKQYVSIEDIENYNDELNEVIFANNEIENILQKTISKEGLNKNEAMAFVKRLGLNSLEELDEIMQGEFLSQEALRLFGLAFNLSEITAKLYLKIRWQVKFSQ